MRKPGRPALWAGFVVLLIVLAACSGGGKPSGGGAPSPQATAQPTEEPQATSRTVEVGALAVSVSSSGAFGEAITDRITVAPSDTGELKVSFAETEVGGIGPSLKASGWTGIAVASLLLGIDPRQYEFTFEPVGGNVDGNSSSGLYTVGVLAAILGDDIRSDASMTGGINPDGTLGPVGGIPHKVQGAAEAGKELVLVPAMQRFDVDLNTGQPVDLVELGSTLGVEVEPVSTVYEAYELLTGNPLPRPSGVGAPELPADAFSKLKATTTEWLGRYEAALNRFLGLPETYGYEQDVLVGDQFATAADQALREGLAAVAYERAATAAALAEGALQAVDLANAYLSGGIDGLISEVSALASAETRLSATLERLAAESARTATDTLALVDAYSNAAVAFGLIQGAGQLVQFLQEGQVSEDEALGLIFSIATSYSQGDFFLDLAENNLVYGLGFGQALPPDPEVIAAIAETLRRAADANLALIEALIVEPQAANFGVSADEFRNFLLGTDTDFATTLGAVDAVGYFAQTLTEEPQASIARLGSSLTAWGESALVVAKYYSLAAELDEGFNVVGFGRERALTDMLDLADQRAEELLSLVGDEEPVTPIYYHENATSYREGSADDKVTSLFYDWQAAVLAEALAYFNGTFDSAISEAGASPLWEWGAASIGGGLTDEGP